MVKFFTVALIALIFVCETICAQDGSPDLSFDRDGRVITVFGDLSSNVKDLVIQPDQKIIAAGSVFGTGGYSQFALVRYNTDGSLDTAFGVDGKAIAEFPGLYMDVSSLILQPDGKLLVGGHIFTYSDGESFRQFVVARFTDSGLLDTAFGTGGKVATNLRGDENEILSMALQNNGKIIVSGYSSNNTSSDYVLIRYNANGSLDSDFGEDGIVITSVKTRDYPCGLFFQVDEKIVVVGSSANYNTDIGFDYDFTLMRYNTNGTIDTSFGDSGIVLVDNGDNDYAKSVKLQSDGKIVVVGSSTMSGNPSVLFRIMRFLEDGNLDMDFGVDGIVTTVLPYEYIEGVEFQIDGKILITEYHGTGGCCSADIKLIRLLSNGEFDTTFGSNGIVTADFINQSSQAYAIAVQSDGKIVIGGGSANQIHVDFALARFNSSVLSNHQNEMNHNGFMVYPNPVRETVTVDFNLQQTKVLSMDLYSNDGRLISNLLKNENFQTGYNSQKLNLPETLAKGIYFLAVSDGKATLNIKIIK